MLTRRGLITGLSALIAAPAIVKASSLMPVRAIEPTTMVEFGEGWVAVMDEHSKIYRVTLTLIKAKWQPIPDHPVSQAA